MPLFALTAALLAAAGLVGVIGRTVTLSKREIGIRMALGARASTVVGRIVLGGMKLALAGLVLGIALSLFLTKTLSSQLYAVSPRDPWCFRTSRWESFSYRPSPRTSPPGGRPASIPSSCCGANDPGAGLVNAKVGL